MANPEHLAILKQGVKVWNEWREKNPDIRPNLIGAELGGADLHGANLSGANLGGADLRAADLKGGKLYSANLSGANLSRAELSGAHLIETNLSFAILSEADLTDCLVGHLVLLDTDISTVKGLDRIEHQGLSYISIDTIYQSKGNIPEPFLRGCGVPENLITFMRSLTGNAFDFYSCFISHSAKDKRFCERLYADLQAKGVRVWYFSEDAK